MSMLVFKLNQSLIKGAKFNGKKVVKKKSFKLNHELNRA